MVFKFFLKTKHFTSKLLSWERRRSTTAGEGKMVDEDDLGQRWDYPFHFPERYGTSRGRFINSNPTGFLTHTYLE